MKPFHKWTLIAGIVCVFGAPMVGLFFTVIGMETAFRTLGQNGITDPKTLAASVGYGLISTEIGIMIAIFGLPLIIGSLVLHFAGKRNKARA